VSAGLLPEVGRPGLPRPVQDGGDVDETGRLLSVAELQDALRAVYARRSGEVTTVPAVWSPMCPDKPAQVAQTADDIQPDPEQDKDGPSGPDGSSAVVTGVLLGAVAGGTRRGGRGNPVRAVGRGVARLPKGFGGAAAVEVGRRLVDPQWPGLRVECFSAGAGGVGAATVTVAIASLAAAVRPHPVLAVETVRGPWRNLYRRVIGTPRGLSADEWLTAQTPSAGTTQVSDVPSSTCGLRAWDTVVDLPMLAERVLSSSVSLFVNRGPLPAARWPTGGPSSRVLVARADPAGVDAALATASEATTTPELIVLVDTGRFGTARVRAGVRLAGSVAPAVLVPWSAGLQRCPLPIDRLERSCASAIADVMYQLTEHQAPPIEPGNPSSEGNSR